MIKQAILAGDPRAAQFREIIAALNLPGVAGWDLNWGEPFIAVSSDRKTWVRIFYEESLPLSSARFEHETERFLPLLPADGTLVFCFPQVWGLSAADLPFNAAERLSFWTYTRAESGMMAREVKAEAEQAVQAGEEDPVSIAEERLEADEIRHLAEIGLLLRRNQHKKAS